MDKISFGKVAVLVLGVFMVAGVASASTIVPGQQDRYDSDDNGYPDEGVTVTGAYDSLYAYDANEDWYWDLGDGRIWGTVDSVEELEESTLTTCDYQVQYRGNFENDPFLDSGWINNEVNCQGYDDNGTYSSTIVHETDPRYRGDDDLSIWGNWEYHTNTESGVGNLARPETPVGL